MLILSLSFVIGSQPLRPIVYAYISKLLLSASLYSPLLTERAAVGLLRLAYYVAQQVRSTFDIEESRPDSLLLLNVGLYA